MKLPFDGSPSARSMTRCDHCSTSGHSRLAVFGRIKEGESPTVKFASSSDSMSVQVSDASLEASEIRP